MVRYVLFMASSAVVLSAMGDAWDNGDDVGSGATTLSISPILQTHGPHTLSNAVDTADWFVIYLEANKRYRFESRGSSDTEANLYFDAAGSTEVDYQSYQVGDAGEDSNFQVLYTPSVSQNYYLKVTDYFGGNAEYLLDYVNEPTLDNWDPGDDSSTNATFLAIDSTTRVHGEHKLGPTDYYDWFGFLLAEGVRYGFETTGGWDTQGALYNSDLALLNDPENPAEDDGGDDTNFKVIYTPTNNGYFYLRVKSYDLGYDINYSLLYYIDDTTDSDGDGMPDAWEIHAFGTNVLASGNRDGDFSDNLTEYIAGTDPTNSAAFFAITNFDAESLVIEWPSVSAREYRVFWTENLTNTFQQQGPVIDYPQNSYTDTVHAAMDRGFYKVEVQLK